MFRLKLFIAMVFIIQMMPSTPINAQQVQKYGFRRQNLHKYHSHTRDPQLEFLLKLLRGGPPGRQTRTLSTISQNLRFLSEILGQDARIEAQSTKKTVDYQVYMNYDTIKFRLWVLNNRTSRVIGGVYRPNGLFEHRNGIFELVLYSREVNMVLKFIPRGNKYQIIMNYR